MQVVRIGHCREKERENPQTRGLGERALRQVTDSSGQRNAQQEPNQRLPTFSFLHVNQALSSVAGASTLATVQYCTVLVQ